MASASIESSPNTYFGTSPGSPALVNLCSYPPSVKDSPAAPSYVPSGPSQGPKVQFNIPNEKTKKVAKGFQGRRKRCVSTSEIYGGKKRRNESFVLPTKFLLGGNAFDPLNLEGLAEGRQSAQVTPDSSPFATPAHRKEVEVYIPANVHDPLNLNPLLEGKEEDVTVLPSGRQRSKSDGETSILINASTSVVVPDKLEISTFHTLKIVASDQSSNADSSKQATRIEDKIVSPVIPQPGAAQFPPQGPLWKKQKVCTYGNYNRYYGYRNPNHEEDPRLKVLKREYFEDKIVLDIGCNIGHITWSVARYLKPRHVTGIDIDQELIGIARKNLKYYMDDNVPAKLKSLYGQFKGRSLGGKEQSFPHNIAFAVANYVLASDDLLEVQTPDYDLILCLSVTKWVHLNWGDEGIKRVFKRAFRQLRPGGKLILEPQDWKSYKKKKKLTPKIFEIFQSIKLRPHMFPEYLTKEVGFSRFEIIQVPAHKSKGFQRPVYVYYKDELKSEDEKEPADAASEETVAQNVGARTEPDSELEPFANNIVIQVENSDLGQTGNLDKPEISVESVEVEMEVSKGQGEDIVMNKDVIPSVDVLNIQIRDQNVEPVVKMDIEPPLMTLEESSSKPNVAETSSICEVDGNLPKSLPNEEGAADLSNKCDLLLETSDSSFSKVTEVSSIKVLESCQSEALCKNEEFQSEQSDTANLVSVERKIEVTVERTVSLQKHSESNSEDKDKRGSDNTLAPGKTM